MPYVERGEDGIIKGVYSNLQPGYAEEFLPDNDPEVIAYLAPPSPPYTIGASLPWSRMTEEEAEIVQDAIDSSPSKTRNMINKATSFTFGTDAFNKLKAIIATTLDANRAETLMGPLLASELSSAEESI